MSSVCGHEYSDHSTLANTGMKIKIAAAANRLFSKHGFAEPGVEAIREAADVSIRTLYKHYPSKDAMIVAALAYRHEAYLVHLRRDAPSAPGLAAIEHLFQRLAAWMSGNGTRGCLFLQAFAAYPESAAINNEVERNKEGVRAEIARRVPAHNQAIVPILFLLHEGVTAAASSVGAKAAAESAISATKELLAGNDRPRG